MIFLTIILFFLGLFFLLGGGRLLVLGAGQLARTLGVTSLVIGLTVVSFGTSAPEFAFSIAGAWKGEGGLVIGNIVGSNIFNILIVLGICSLFTPLFIRKQLIWWDVPVMILSTLLFWLFAWEKTLYRFEGAILCIGMLFYLFFAFRMGKKEAYNEEIILPHHPVWLQIVWLMLGLVLLVVGSQLLVDSATKLAQALGISELLIGLTLLATGTSLPELATSLMAVRKKENDLAVGNVIGSCIINILGVIGITGLISPIPVQVPYKASTFDIPILAGISIATLPIALTGHLIARWEGALFLFYYLLYLLFLFFEARFTYYLPFLETAFFFFILPFTAITLMIGIIRHFFVK